MRTSYSNCKALTKGHAVHGSSESDFLWFDLVIPQIQVSFSCISQNQSQRGGREGRGDERGRSEGGEREGCTHYQ